MTWRELQQKVADEEVRLGISLADYEVGRPERSVESVTANLESHWIELRG